MSTQQLVLELKENKQDFEFYPTTDEMLAVVCTNINWFNQPSILDIGCGTCALKTYIDRYNERTKAYNQQMSAAGINTDRKNFRTYNNYYGIEKSEILLNRLPADVYVLGTDFNNTTLIDKKADVIFCNPPYSEYEEWTNRIIREGNFKIAFLVIPARWKDNARIQASLEAAKVRADTLKSLDFLHAERQARAVVDIVKLTKRRDTYSDEGKDPFELWFEDTFKISSKDEGKVHEYEEERKRKEAVKTALITANNKIETLVNLYNDDMNKLYNSFSLICGLDEDILKDIGVNYAGVKEALKHKIENKKVLYWQTVFDYLDEITDRLTAQSRRELFDKFERLNTVDFNEANIRSVVIWVIKNAADYYNKQLIEFYKKLSSFENVKPYKSNEKTFKRDNWRWGHSEDEKGKYTLDYRIICSYLFKCETGWHGEFSEWNERENRDVINDFCAIARNLGFETGIKENADEFGKKFYVYMRDGKPLFEYKIYQNRNTHVKLNIEFAKAMNVEVARLLGWIRSKEDIAAEFPADMAKGAEKYFNTNFSVSLANPNIKLLAASKE